MARILVAARLPTAGAEARQGVIDHLKAAAKYSRELEPGVHKYMILVPQDQSDTKTVWAIEEYADQKALDEHMATAPVKEMISFMGSNPALLEGAPTIRQLRWVDDMAFAKPEAGQLSNPFVVFAHLEFNPGKRSETLPYWQGNLACSKDESGTLVYGIAEESDKPDELFTLEVYESEDYLWNVHVKADAVQENINKTKDLRKNLTLAKLELVGGYMCRA